MSVRQPRCSIGFSAIATCVVAALLWLNPTPMYGQDLGGAGTVGGTVTDPSGGVMVSATVEIANAVSGLKRTTLTDSAGKFVFRNLPRNPYQIVVTAQGFKPLERSLTLNSAVPMDLTLTMALAGAAESIVVTGGDLMAECAHRPRPDCRFTAADRIAVGTQPSDHARGSGVVADSNGFFHPIGDRADPIRARRSARNRPAEPRLFEPDFPRGRAIDGSDYRRRGRPNMATRAVSSWRCVTKSGIDLTRRGGTLSWIRLLRHAGDRRHVRAGVARGRQLRVGHWRANGSLSRLAGVFGPSRWRRERDAVRPVRSRDRTAPARCT